ncbi:hypothetical protein C8R46DRAFT_1358069 [Mycena filopes]|nr:hypothetical protein C8R46DRAFT_1358069 [Mycena filopes]
MSSKLYVGNLSWNTNDDSLHQAFAQHGQVTDSIVMKDRETGKSRGFGFVTYGSDEEAQKAIDAMNDQELDGRQIRVNIAQGRSGGLFEVEVEEAMVAEAEDMAAVVAVTAAAPATTTTAVATTFAEFGQVTDTIVMRDRDTGRARGFGFVTYSSAHEAEVAMRKMNDQDLDGRRLRVNRAQSQGGGGGYTRNQNHSSESNINEAPGGFTGLPEPVAPMDANANDDDTSMSY